MIKDIIAKRYSKAIFYYAYDNNKIEKIYEELQLIQQLINSNNELKNILLDQNIKKDKKIDVLKKLNLKVSIEVENFINILIKKDRLVLLDKIVNDFKIRIDKNNNIMSGDIYSPKILSKDLISEIEEKIGQVINKEVKLHNKIDKSLIAGFKIDVYGYNIDGSVKQQLEKLRKKVIIK